MENIVQALKIAAGVLFAMMVVGLFIYLLSILRPYKDAEERAATVAEIQKFNKNFESYNTQVLTGFKLISVGNLANDANVTYANVDDYEPVKIYFKLINSNGHPDGWDTFDNSPTSEEYKKVKKSDGTITDKEYFNLLKYVGETGNGPYYQAGVKDQNKFKKLYFQCVDVTYDSNSARVIQMLYNEIKKAS